MNRTRAFAGILLAAALAAGCAPEEPAGVVAFPPWEGASLADGRPVRLDAGEGAIVLNVWATWCEPCRREMASLEAAHRRLASRGIRVVGVNVDRDVLLAREHVRRMGLTFANLSDPDQKLARDRLGVRRLPTTLGVGVDGRLLWRDEAARDWAEAARLDWVARSLAGEKR